MTPRQLPSLGRLAPLALATLTAGAAAAPARAASTKLPSSGGKVRTCHKSLFNVAGSFPVTVDYAAQKGQHPEKSLLSCANAQQVAVKGKAFYHEYPFGVGKTVKVGTVTYTMGESTSGNIGGKPVSGPVYGWAGGGIVVYLINASG